MEIATKSAQETFEFGKKLANNLKKGGVVACYGELGSGKTTFIQGVLNGLGVKKRVVSPTFIFIREYKHELTRIYHIDLYRIEKSEEVRGLGLEEIFANKKAIIAIEWAEKIKNILPKKRIDVKFEILSENERRITTSYQNY